MENNYKELVEKYLGTGRVTQLTWERNADKVERGYCSGEVTEDGDGIVIHMEELVNGHAGQYVMNEFCKWFGIEYGEEENDLETVVTDFDALVDEFTTWLDEHKLATMLGSFCIGYNDSDGSLDLSFIADRITLSFKAWRRDEGYVCWDRLYSSELDDGKEYDEICDIWQGIKDEFEEYCDTNNYIADMDED